MEEFKYFILYMKDVHNFRPKKESWKNKYDISRG